MLFDNGDVIMSKLTPNHTDLAGMTEALTFESSVIKRIETLQVKIEQQ